MTAPRHTHQDYGECRPSEGRCVPMQHEGDDVGDDVNREQADHAKAVNRPAEEYRAECECRSAKREDGDEREVRPSFDLGEVGLVEPEHGAEP